MRIALCHPYVLPAKGGCERYILELSKRLRADGHEVQWHAWRWQEQDVPAGVRCIRVRGPAAPWRPRRPWLFGDACLRSLRATPHDLSIGFDKTWGQDILFPQGGLYSETALGNRRVPRTVLGRWMVAAGQWADPAYWSFLRLEQRQYLDHASVVVVNSRMVRDHFLERFALAEHRLRVIPSAIDQRRFDAARAVEVRARSRQRWQLPPDATVAVFAAMNPALKGLAPLLHAVRRLPRASPFYLLITGQPSTRRVQRLVRWLGVTDKLHFLGHERDMCDVLHAADFMIHPTFYDPCSLVVLEALACGLPVISTRFNGASELPHVRSAGHILDDPHDVERLTWAIEDLLDPARRAACTRAARLAAASWTFEDHYRAILDTMYEAAAVRARRPFRARAA